MPRTAVQPHPFDVAAELASLGTDPAHGGLASYIGQVRGTGGLLALILEHYPAMTERALAAIAAAAEARFAPCRTLILHRTGRLPAGASIVLAAASSPHRLQAQDAVRYMMDRLKTDAPFWKKEEYPDGARWVEAATQDDATRAAWEGQPRPPPLPADHGV